MAKRSDEQLYTLPEILHSDFEMQQKDEICRLLREAHEQKLLADAADKRLKKAKARLTELLQGTPGARSGEFCCIIGWQGGRETLDRTLLVENGVTPEQIKKSMKKGDGSWRVELPRIGTPDEEG
jgi:hypothetical protein